MKNIFVLACSLFTNILFSQNGQLGINTDTPTTTLDVRGSKDLSHPAGIQAPRLTLEELTAKGENLYGNIQKGALIYIIDISKGQAIGQRSQVKSVGYYYFNGTKWEKLLTKANGYKNIYNSNGVLIGDRKVMEDAYTLTFEGNMKGANKFINTKGTVDNQVSPIKIIDGGQAKGKVLTSDREGNAIWKAPATQRVLGDFGIGVPLYSYNKVMYTGASITLPPGKWVVYLGGTLEMAYSTNLENNIGNFWVTFFFSDKENETSMYRSTRDGQDNGTTYLVGKLIPTNTTKDFISATQVLYNQTGQNKTYYLQFLTNSNYSNVGYGVRTMPNHTGNHIIKIFAEDKGDNVGAKYFYAIKVADQ